MATEELVTEQFQFLGIDIQKEVLTKCVSLCEEYNVDAETFIEQWMAFSLTHLNGCPPTLENLKLLEKKEFSKATSRPNALANDAASTGSSLTVYGAQVSTQPDNEVLSDYMTTTPKRVKIETEVVTTQELQPATYSPVVGNSAKYASRANPGTVVHSFGEDKILQALAKANGPNDILDLCITQVPNEDGDMYTKAMFGFELLHEKASTFDNHIQYVSQCILKKAGLTETTSTEVLVAGRIECDADARLNSKSVILQGTWEASLSQAVTVDMDSLKQYSLFPGQVVVMRGLNPRGDKFIPKDVYCDAAQPIPNPKADMMNTLKGPLSMLVVAGPYTTSDNMSYEPLKDFITYVGNQKPHVVIMTGPFMDCDHIKVKDNTMAETYKSFFDKLMDSLGELNTTSPYTKIYIVSSSKDVFHVNMFPTDSAVLEGMGGDKLARLANHVVMQRTYYPLWPPSPGLCLDAALWAAHAQLPCTPHVLVLPSNFRYFIKDVNGCVVVNPEHLTKGTGGGTFSRILITDSGDIPKKIAAQIVRI
ncbi:DNA polymerase alpha subunit B [Papilio machaon]|uniref:DNA polymerase alpha subunit B n=1 Tax=Papilio machaon TaxID=76193 RepID=A0A194RL19_PAPMA|nr:DNA polymerase alpha subunit B [Papilio machaon]